MKAVLKPNEPIIIFAMRIDAPHLSRMLRETTDEPVPIYENQLLACWNEGSTRAQVTWNRRVGAVFLVHANYGGVEEAIRFLRDYALDYPRVWRANAPFAYISSGLYLSPTKWQSDNTPLIHLLGKNPRLAKRMHLDFALPTPAYLEPSPPKIIDSLCTRMIKICSAIGSFPLPPLRGSTALRYETVSNKDERKVKRVLKEANVIFNVTRREQPDQLLGGMMIKKSMFNIYG